jgi:hypothetical protein
VVASFVGWKAQFRQRLAPPFSGCSGYAERAVVGAKESVISSRQSFFCRYIAPIATYMTLGRRTRVLLKRASCSDDVGA